MRWPIALAVMIASVPARANPLDVFGFSSRRAGQANAGVATTDDATSLYYDPAGLVASPGGEVMLGTLGAYSHLSINTRRAALSDPFGFQLAVRAPVPLGGALADRIAVGLGLHLLPRTIARITAPPPDHAFYPYYGDRLSRAVILPGAAVRLGHGLSIGAAVNLLASSTGSIDAGGDAAGPLEARVVERMPAVARAIAGVHWQVSPGVRLGAVYRQRFEIPVATSTATIVDGEAIDVDLRAAGQFTPHQVVAGIGWATDAFATSFDIGWAKWSGYRGPYVRVDSQLPSVAPIAVRAPNVPFEDSFSVRAGIESLSDDGMVFRGGYGFESSAVPHTQRGVTNLLDGTKHTAAFGTGYAWRRVRVDAHVNVQVVSTRRMTKDVHDGMSPYDPYTSLRDEDSDAAGTQTTNPGYPSIKSGGEVLSAGLTLEVAL